MFLDQFIFMWLKPQSGGGGGGIGSVTPIISVIPGSGMGNGF